MQPFMMPKTTLILCILFLSLLLSIATALSEQPISTIAVKSTIPSWGQHRGRSLQDAYVGSGEVSSLQKAHFAQHQLLAPLQDGDDPIDPPPDTKPIFEGFYNTQPPIGGSPIYFVSVNFNRPRGLNETHNTIPLNYLFSLEVDDPDFELPQYHSITVEMWQVYPSYKRIVRDTIINGDGHDRTINLATRPFQLKWSPTGHESYHANIVISFPPDRITTKISNESNFNVWFKIIPAERPEYDLEKPLTFWLGPLSIYPRSIQSQSYGSVSSSPIEYPVNGVQLGEPMISKTGSKLNIPYSQTQDVLTKFEIWVAYQSDPSKPTPGIEFFDGQASTLSLALLNGVAGFAHVQDEAINETFDGCFINKIRIPVSKISLSAQALYFDLDVDQMEGIYKYNRHLLHFECHSVFYIVIPNATQKQRISDEIAAVVQIQRFFDATGGKNPHNDGFNRLNQTEQSDILNAWSQLVPVSYKSLYSTIPIPISITYPSMTEYIIVEKPHQFKLTDDEMIGVKGNLFQPNSQSPAVVAPSPLSILSQLNPFSSPEPQSMSSFTPLAQGTGKNNAENNNPANPHPDQKRYVYIPSYSHRAEAFDDDFQPELSQLSPEIASVGAIQWFGTYRPTLQDKAYETLAVTCSFQYTIPVRIDPNGQLYDRTGVGAFKNQFMSEPGMAEVPPRFRIFVPYLQTIPRPEMVDSFRLLYIQISSIQTGFVWSGQVSWDGSAMGYTNWIDLDYETILFPPELMVKGEIDSGFYFNNPPVIEITFNTYGGMVDFPLDANGRLDFTNYPEQCALDLQHSVIVDYLTTTDVGLDGLQHLNSDITIRPQPTPTIININNTTNTPTPQSRNLFTLEQQSNQSLDLSPSIAAQSLALDTTNQQLLAIDTNSQQSLALDDQQSITAVTPRRYQTFFLTQPIPYHDLNNYMQTGVELTALSSTVPHFRIINHNEEPIQGMLFYLGGLFSFGIPPSSRDANGSNPSTLSDDVKIWCGTEKKNHKNLKRCFAKEIKWKPNFVYIVLKAPVIYHIEIHLSDTPYLWYRRGVLTQYPEQSHVLFPVITLQVQHNSGDPLFPNKLQSLTTIMNQTVTMSFPYADKLAPRSSRANRPFEWTLDASVAAIVAWASVAFCGGIVLTLGGMALYYWYGARTIMKSKKQSAGDDDLDLRDADGEYSKVDPSSGVAMAPIATAAAGSAEPSKRGNKADKKSVKKEQRLLPGLNSTASSSDVYAVDDFDQISSIGGGAYLQLSINHDDFNTNSNNPFISPIAAATTRSSRYNLDDLDLDDNFSSFDQM